MCSTLFITNCRATQQARNRNQVFEPFTHTLIVSRSCDFAIFTPTKITKSNYEEVLIEKSINSARISIKIKKMDDVDRLLCHKFAAFLTQRAEKFMILRRKPIQVLKI